MKNKKYFSAVWIATVANIDFPSKPGISAAEQKKELDIIVDNAVKANLNGILFQVRPCADALYKSKLFPTSIYLVNEQGDPLPNGFDPLDYIIEKAHLNGIELHAWINPYRITSGGSAEKPKHDINALCETSPARLHPEYTVCYADGKMYFNPAIPEVRKLIEDGIKEIIENYDVDGIHFDDYFYPYPARIEKDGESVIAEYDDKKEYALYGNGKTLDDWRRENVNILIKECYELIKSIKPKCSFGISPFAIWRNEKSGVTDGVIGSDTNGLECYSALYCDAVAWVKGGYLDYICPQIYWRFETAVARFGTLLEWWDNIISKYCPQMGLYVGHGVYRIEDWNSSEEIAKQIEACKNSEHCTGSVYFGYSKIASDALGIREIIINAKVD